MAELMTVDFLVRLGIVGTLGGLISALILYASFRRVSTSIWGYLSSFLYDLPVLFLLLAGFSGMEQNLLIVNAAGLIFIPPFVSVLNLLHLEFSLVRALSWFPWPSFMRTVRRFKSLMDKLEEYRVIPRPVAMKQVYLASLVSGIVHLAVNLIYGPFV